MPLTTPNFVAGGNIRCSRFVYISADNTVSEASAATSFLIGVSAAGTDFPPINDSHYDATAATYAAVAGELVRVYGAGEVCLLTASTSITQGQILTATTAGKAVAITTGGGTTTPQYYGAIALEDASGDGVLFRAMVLPGVYTYAA